MSALKASRIREMFKMYANEARPSPESSDCPRACGTSSQGRPRVRRTASAVSRRWRPSCHWNQRRCQDPRRIPWNRAASGTGPYGSSRRRHADRPQRDHAGVVQTDHGLSDPDAPHDDCSLGVDAVSNISRFFAYLIDNNVRFTVKGEIFKTTENDPDGLIPNPGRELERSEILQSSTSLGARLHRGDGRAHLQAHESRSRMGGTGA